LYDFNRIGGRQAIFTIFYYICIPLHCSLPVYETEYLYGAAHTNPVTTYYCIMYRYAMKVKESYGTNANDTVR